MNYFFVTYQHPRRGPVRRALRLSASSQLFPRIIVLLTATAHTQMRQNQRVKRMWRGELNGEPCSDYYYHRQQVDTHTPRVALTQQAARLV